MAKRNDFLANLKAKFALSAICVDGTMVELASRYDNHPNMIANWKQQRLAEINTVQTENRRIDSRARLIVEILRSLSVDRRRKMIEQQFPKQSLSRQSELISISHSSYYYQPSGESDLNRELMRPD